MIDKEYHDKIKEIAGFIYEEACSIDCVDYLSVSDDILKYIRNEIIVAEKKSTEEMFNFFAKSDKRK